ncbi:MAG: DUF2167 domain-containing protein [Gemmatimonadaceae bacterium]|nr:DUF2167 domain-containing protein [Gemmatimonadaceae bacterium]
MSVLRRALFVAALVAAPIVALAQQADSGSKMTAEKFEASLNWREGDVVLGNGLATVHLPVAYRYLGPGDAERVLTAWGNLPGQKTLGMIFPAGMHALEEGTWAVVVQYDEDGHVDDSDAAKIDYTSLLENMKKETEERNAERKKQGVATATLVGWAAPPAYDGNTHKLRWAKELAFAGEDEHTINWDIRVLGARGVLDLDAVGSKSQLATLQAGTGDVLGFVDFNQGHRYADYKPGVDRKAEYGIAALVAGGLLAKAGFFKVLLGALIAMKKLLIVAAAGIAGFFRKLFGRKEQHPTPAAPPAAS